MSTALAKLLSSLLILLWFAAVGFFSAKLSTPLNDRDRESYQLVEPPPFADAGPRVIDFLTLGYTHIFRHYATIWTLQFLSTPLDANKVSKQQYERAVLPTSKLKPTTEHWYILGCLQSTEVYRSSKICEKLVAEGQRAFPKSWKIPASLAVILMDSQPNKAALFLQNASTKPGAPPFYKNIWKKLISREYIDEKTKKRSLELLMEE